MYNLQNYNGILFQAALQSPKNIREVEIVAAGGRYDELISKFRHPTSKPIPLCAVGVNIAIDKIIALHMNEVHNELVFPLFLFFSFFNRIYNKKFNDRNLMNQFKQESKIMFKYIFALFLLKMKIQ